MSDHKPTCGTQALSVDSTFTTILLIISIISGAVGAYKAVAAAAIWAGAAAGAAVVVGLIAVFWYQRCFDREGLSDQCSSGVVTGIQDSFTKTSEVLFPFTAQHPRIDLVVMSRYWSLVETDAAYIKCTEHTDPVEKSPILQSFFKSDLVCSTMIGALIGAIIFGGIGIAVAIAIVAGCALTGPFFLLCLLAAFLIAALFALLGAFIGGSIVNSGPTGPGPEVEGRTIFKGFYISVRGTLVRHGDFSDAIVYWFVNESGFHGTSLEEGPPYSYIDADNNIISDFCDIPPPVQ